jgi:hypothetical protein
MRSILWSVLPFLLAIGQASLAEAASRCYDLAKGEPRSLTGILEYVVFAGPPNYEDVQKGDTPEPSYVLRLAQPICLTGDEFADPKNTFRSVQVVETESRSGQLKRFLGKPVTLSLTKPMAAETGHHHEPLVAWVTAVASARKPLDFVDEYGTAATTIRAFYAALKDGQGAAAAEMIVPEKRKLPAFSSTELTRFYGSLKEPIELLDISRSEPSAFIAHYRYTTSERACDGRAIVSTTLRNGRNFIESIKALNGC